MNRVTGMCGAAVNAFAVLAFAVSMLFGFDAGSYFSSMFIVFGFVLMIGGFAFYAETDAKVPGYVAMAMAAAYAAVITVVYFTQLTVVRSGGLGEEAAKLLDFQRFGLLFNLDMLGYAMMSLATFFAGLTVRTRTKADRVLKWLLILHGMFFISCLLFPMLGVFTENSDAIIGVIVLEIWCAWFLPTGILSFMHFKNKE